MPESTRLEKAELRQLDAKFAEEIKPDTWTKVQFNPETLKVNFANQLATPAGAGDKNGTPARQFVGAGTTKLAVQLWFDVTAPVPEGLAQEDDVRKLTQKVAYFITPQGEGDQLLPPAVRFLWGSFQFDGIMESLDESLELFSSEGKPLRASVSFNLTQQKITKFTFRDTGGPGGGGASTPGTRPLIAATAGATVQGLAASEGRGDDWQAIAAANGIENPRQLKPGQFIDFNAPKLRTE